MVPEKTPNLKLKKPDYENGVADIRIFNENWDILDEANKNIENEMTETNDKVDNGLNKKLNKGTYEGDADDLKREIDGKLPLSGGEMNGNIHNNMHSNTEGLYSFTRHAALKPEKFVGGIKANWFSDTATFGIIRSESTQLLNNCLKLKLNDVLYDVYHSGYDDSGFTTSDKTIKGAINELNDEISKKASINTLGRMMVGSYLSADGSGRVSVKVQDDPSVRDESSAASSVATFKLYKNKIDNRNNSEDLMDLNTMKKDGFYSGYKWVNAPNGMKLMIACLDVKKYSNDWVVQVLYAMDTNGLYGTYQRAFFSGTSWGEWVEIVTDKSKVLAGLIGNEINYIQQPGVKTPDKIYIDTTTKKLYRPRTNTNDTQVTQNFRAVSILDNSNGIGFGQKYKKVKIPEGSRQTNNTGRPIFYSVTEGGNGRIEIYVDDILIAWYISNDNDSPTSFIVPAGSTWYWTGGVTHLEICELS